MPLSNTVTERVDDMKKIADRSGWIVSQLKYLDDLLECDPVNIAYELRTNRMGIVFEAGSCHKSAKPAIDQLLRSCVQLQRDALAKELSLLIK